MQASDYESLEKHEILKDILPSLYGNFEAQGTIEAQYAKPEVNAQMGNELLPSETKDAPVVTYHANKPLDLDATYTYAMTDPDAPSRTDNKWGEICHYVATGIKFESAKGGVVSDKGHGVMPYVGPGPPKDTGLHRYIFMVFKEPKGKTEFTEIKNYVQWGYGVQGAGIERWSKENDLELLAINFFFAQNEENNK
ncbi:carboxypeptidase Y inhibitor [Monosporozyma unispora]|nr:hypothetical protein C6P44_000428 [Kazachstania unispora]